MNLPSAIHNSNLLQQIAEHSLSAFFIYNLQTHQFDYLNSAFEDIWERPAVQINEDLPALLAGISEEDMLSLQKSYERLLGTALRQSLEFRIHPEEDREKWISVTAYTIIEQGQRLWLAGFAEDITHYKENEIIANKFSAHKNAMLEMLSHDLGGPLGIALQLADKLQQQGRQSGIKSLEDNAGIIHQTLRQSIHLIHDYLEKEYLESSQTALMKQRIELITQLQALLDGFKRMDTENQKHFHLASSSPQVFVDVDQTKFLQVFSNLVSNAIKFTHKNGHITIRVQAQAHSLLISVSDDGIGIPTALQGKIFDRFTKARRPGLRGEETVGLGLSIVKRIVEMHQGRIWVESAENEGATFFVEIPYKD